jgi:predicted ATP-grasp superfamily ATP-dependent carboligase
MTSGDVNFLFQFRFIMEQAFKNFERSIMEQTIIDRTSNTQPGAVVLGAFATGLHAARVLWRRGIDVAVVTLGEHDIAQYSRCRSETAALAAPHTPAHLSELLRDKRSHWNGRVLIPGSDIALEALSIARTELSQHYRLYVPDWEVSRVLLRKDRTYEAARSAGIALPEHFGRASPDLITQFRGRFPVLMKPIDSAAFQRTFGTKVFVVSNQDELASRLADLETHGLDAELLELIPGPDTCSFNYTAFLDDDGQVLAECALRKIRKNPPSFGIARVVETLHDPATWDALRTPTLLLLRRIGWYGPVSAEYKLDPRNGRFVLMEINGRCAFVHRLASACGIDYPWLLYQAALGRSLPATSPNQWRGVMIHLHADILSALLGRDRGQIGWRDYVSPYLRNKVFAVWDWRDPLPFFAEWGRSLRRASSSRPAKWRTL